MKVLNKVILIKTWSLESTGAAPGPLHPYQTCPDVACDAPIRLFFSIRLKLTDSLWFGPIPAETRAETVDMVQFRPKQPSNQTDTAWFQPIRPLKQAKMGRWLPSLPFFSFMWPCGKKKRKKKEREWERRKKKMRRHKEMVRT